MNQKRYWLRGGLTALGLVVVMMILNDLIWKIPQGYSLGAILKSYNFSNLVGLVIYFLIGASIGFLYGRVKNKKSESNY